MFCEWQFGLEPERTPVSVSRCFIRSGWVPCNGLMASDGHFLPILQDPTPLDKGTSTGKRKRKAEVLPERNTMHKYLCAYGHTLIVALVPYGFCTLLLVLATIQSPWF